MTHPDAGYPTPPAAEQTKKKTHSMTPQENGEPETLHKKALVRAERILQRLREQYERDPSPLLANDIRNVAEWRDRIRRGEE